MASDIQCIEHTVLDYPEYRFDLDEYKRGSGQLLIAHLRVHHWSASTLKRILKEWRVFRQCVTAPVFALAEMDDEKWAAFVSLLGFKPHSEVVCNNGERRRLFIHQVSTANASQIDCTPNAVQTDNR